MPEEHLLTQSMITQESHHSGLRPLRLTQASPATIIIAMMIPYAMKPLPYRVRVKNEGKYQSHFRLDIP